MLRICCPYRAVESFYYKMLREHGEELVETVRVASWGSGSSKTRRSWGQQGEDARLDSWSD